MVGSLRVGCSGWVYDDWRGRIYPADLPRRCWFEHYTTYFDTVEINSTFYRLPPPATVETWRSRAPDGFVFAPKLGQYASHRKKLKDPDQWVGNHLDRVERLGDHLGPTLVQLPPRWRRDTPRLEAFLAAVPAGLRWAVEFRDPDWLHDDTFDVLARHGAALVVHDLLADHPWERTAPFTYARFHGPHALDDRYRGRYTGRRLWRAADRLAAWLDDGTDVYAYFNNDHDGDAVHDARWLRDGIGERVS